MKYIKKTLLFLLWIVSLNLSAQSIFNETIYLKNGSKIKGYITEIVPNVSYTIQTQDGSIIVCNVSDIIKIVRDLPQIQTQEKVNSNAKDSFVFKPGYRGILEAGYGMGTGTYGFDVFNFNFVNGYQLNKKMFVGIGTGFKSFNNGKLNLLPLYADFKYSFLNEKISPFLSMNAGFSFNPNDGFKGEGILFNPSLGVQIKGKNNVRYNIGLNYQTQQMNFYVLSDDMRYFTSIIRFSESIGLTLGIVF
jgi:hypothetical protein